MLLPNQVGGDIGELLSQQHCEEKAKKRCIFITILQNIGFLACPGLSPRDSSDLERDSNSLQLLNLRGEDCLEVKTWLNKKTDR